LRAFYVIVYYSVALVAVVSAVRAKSAIMRALPMLVLMQTAHSCPATDGKQIGLSTLHIHTFDTALGRLTPDFTSFRGWNL
jgi:hypothetical protein